MSNPLRALFLVLASLSIVSLAGGAGARPVDPYDAAMARSAEAEARGDLAAAARALEEVIPAYPQDYAIVLRLGSIYHRAGRFTDAERAHRSALAIAAQSLDVRLGLAWALVRQDRCDDAHEVLSPMLEDPRAKEAMAACIPGGRGRGAAGAAGALPADPYDAAMVRSAEAEARGDLAAAARALEEVIPAYPQDHAILLRLGSIYHGSGRFTDAERAYRSALAIAAQSAEARLGLAWALVRQGRCDDAQEALSPMLDAEDPRAREAVAACVPSGVGVSVFVAYNQYIFPDHPIKRAGTGVLLSVGGQTAGGLVLQGAFRGVAFTAVPGSGVSNFTQQEIYGRVGYTVPSAAVLLQGAVVFDGSGELTTSKHVGLAGRWSPAGDLLLEATLSLYDDLTVGRVAPGWSIPIVGPLRFTPVVAFQATGSEFKVTGSGTASLAWPSLSLWAGGKYGQEIRPAYLSQLAVYNIPERVTWGAWAGARVRLHRLLSVQASYALDRVHRTDGLTPSNSFTHAITAGPLLTF